MDGQLLSLVGVVFVSVACAAAAIFSLVFDQQPAAQRRLATVAQTPTGASSSESLLGDQLTPLNKRMRSFVPKSPKEMSRLQQRLALAGYYGTWPATCLALAQVVTPIAFFFGYLALFGTRYFIFAVIAAGFGYFLPTLWLGRAIEKRKKEIRNGLPDAIDLMIVCIESGSGIDQAISKVAEELALAYPALAHELEMIGTETRAGKPRLEAFKNFADRTKVEDVRSLVTMLVQTDKFGTSVGQALRTHAETSRTKRRQRAEEKAAKLAVKLLFPLVFCLFPAFYVIVLGPSMVKIFRNFVYGG